MAKRRADRAPVGLTSNGILLVNVLGLLNPRQAGRVRASLPAGLGRDWFVGVALEPDDSLRVLSRLDDAAAEAAAAFAGRSFKPQPKSALRKTAKPRARRADKARK